MSLPDLLQWAASSRKTGVLSFTLGSVTRKIHVEDGFIAGSSSNDPTDLFGQWLVSCGRITEDQLRIALGEQERSRTFLGTILVQMRALSEEDANTVLALKTEEVLYGLFEWQEGVFDYQDCTPEQLPFRVALPIQEALLKGLRRLDEMAVIRKEFPDNTVVLRRTATPIPPDVLANPHARRIVEAIDGIRSISAIVLHCHASEFIVSRFLLELMRAGHVDIVHKSPRAPTPPVGPPELSTNGFLAAARALMETQDYASALTVLARAPLTDRDVLAAVESAEAKLAEKIYSEELPPDRIPCLLRPLHELTNEKLTAEESFLLSRIDGEWDVRSIISVSPLREIEALRVLHRLRDRGLVTLK